MEVTGGTVALDYAGTMRMHLLSVGGEELATGVYGAANNTSISADRRLSCFTGTGLIAFVGDNHGTVLTVR